MPDANSHAELFNRALPHDFRQALFGGAGVVRVWSLVGAPLLPFTAILACELEAGASVGTHLQDQYPEIVIGISGTGRVVVNGAPSAFGAGSVVQLPRGYTLAIANESTDSVLSYLIIKSAQA